MGRRIKYSLLAAAAATSLFLGEPLAYAAAREDKTIYDSRIYVTADQYDDGFNRFPSVRRAEGRLYTLAGVEVQVIKEKNSDEEILAYESPGFTKNPEEHLPPETMVEKDITYELSDFQLLETTIEAKSKEVSHSIVYENVEGIDTLPQTAEFEVTDDNTGERLTAVLPLNSHQVRASYWSNDFTFPITVGAYDADVYDLGDLEIPGNSDLSSYGKELLDYLKLPAEDYRITDVRWDGDPYYEDGILCRNAVATGSKWIRKIEARFSGQVLFPEVKGYYYDCIYTRKSDTNEKNDGSSLYTMEATARYVRDGQGKADQETLKDGEAGIYSWIYKHWLEVLSISLAFLGLLALVILCLIRRRRGKNKRAGKKEKSRSLSEQWKNG